MTPEKHAHTYKVCPWPIGTMCPSSNIHSQENEQSLISQIMYYYTAMKVNELQLHTHIHKTVLVTETIWAKSRIHRRWCTDNEIIFNKVRYDPSSIDPAEGESQRVVRWHLARWAEGQRRGSLLLHTVLIGHWLGPFSDFPLTREWGGSGPLSSW